jgi:hypothetical protein
MKVRAEPPFDHPPRPLAQKVGAILWPSFFAACIATMVFFAFVDPLQLRDITFPEADISREAGYHRVLHVLAGYRQRLSVYLDSATAVQPLQ